VPRTLARLLPQPRPKQSWARTDGVQRAPCTGAASRACASVPPAATQQCRAEIIGERVFSVYLAQRSRAPIGGADGARARQSRPLLWLSPAAVASATASRVRLVSFGREHRVRISQYKAALCFQVSTHACDDVCVLERMCFMDGQAHPRFMHCIRQHDAAGQTAW
jgi:hypothetical protein